MRVGGGWGCWTFEFVRAGASSWGGPLFRKREKEADNLITVKIK